MNVRWPFDLDSICINRNQLNALCNREAITGYSFQTVTIKSNMNGYKSRDMHKQRTHLILSILATSLVALFGLLPLYWLLITSFKPPGTEFRLPVEYWPSNFSVESYRVVLGPDFRCSEPSSTA